MRRSTVLSRSFLAASSLAGALAIAACYAPPAHAQLFGPSDEEKAREANQDAQIQQLTTQVQQLDGRIGVLEQRVQSLTDTLTQTTNNNEELHHELSLTNQKIDRMQKDFAYRLCVVSAQQLGASADAQGLNCGASAGAGAAAAPDSGGAAPGAPLAPLGTGGGAQPGGNGGPSTIDASGNNNSGAGAPRQLGRPPGVLGTLPMGYANTPAPPPPAPAAAGNAQADSGAGTDAQFDRAVNLLGRMQYNEAKAAFRAYADTHPDNADLSSQALYWIGHVDFIQRNYQDAQTAFAEAISKYPKAARSADSMLELGQTLLAMGKTKDGCVTLAALKGKFPNASASTLETAQTARRASCR